MLKKLLIPIMFVSFLSIVWLIVAALFMGVTAPWNSGEAESKWETITHPVYDFSLEYPTKWRLQTFGEYGFKGDRDFKLWIYRSQRNSFRVDVRFRGKDLPPTLEDVVLWSNERIEKYKSGNSHADGYYQELEFYEDEVNNHPAIRRIYTMSGMQIEEVYIARQNDMITISLRSPISEFDSYKNDFERIVHSFEPME